MFSHSSLLFCSQDKNTLTKNPLRKKEFISALSSPGIELIMFRRHDSRIRKILDYFVHWRGRDRERERQRKTETERDGDRKRRNGVRQYALRTHLTVTYFL